ncbi:MAG TPA: DinB family protein [Candidatus Acidoferrum sp.]|nr:DinB family protein [Candidatus Acidoferrum sp.]
MGGAIEAAQTGLATAQSEFLRVADLVPADKWATQPEHGGWSAAELVAHLMMVERAVIEKADRVTQKSPRQVPFLKRLHLPMFLVEMRVVRRKSPLPINPELLRGKEEMLAGLRETRERSLAFLEETRGRNLSEYCWAHPAIGTLNLYEWIRFLAAHQVRHTKQMRKIAGNLPKVI